MKYDPPSSSEGSETSVLSRKDLAKAQRHAMYQRAKERRATDPRYLAMKESAKLQQRAAYQKAKERRKAVVADAKAKQKVERRAEHDAQRATRRGEADRELMKLVTWVVNGSTAQND